MEKIKMVVGFIGMASDLLLDLAMIGAVIVFGYVLLQTLDVTLAIGGWEMQSVFNNLF